MVSVKRRTTDNGKGNEARIGKGYGYGYGYGIKTRKPLPLDETGIVTVTD